MQGRFRGNDFLMLRSAAAVARPYAGSLFTIITQFSPGFCHRSLTIGRLAISAQPRRS
jgi:hypothetical protein